MKVAKSIEERIKDAMADANAFIDKRAAEVAKLTPGVPLASIRISITRGIGCACRGALIVAEDMEKENERAA
jgi:hypothetical protein